MKNVLRILHRMLFGPRMDLAEATAVHDAHRIVADIILGDTRDIPTEGLLTLGRISRRLQVRHRILADRILRA